MSRSYDNYRAAGGGRRRRLRAFVQRKKEDWGNIVVRLLDVCPPQREVVTASPSSELWTGGLICAFEFVRGCGLASPADLSRNSSVQSKDLLPAMDASRKPPPVAKNLSDGSDDGDADPRPPACRHGKGPPDGYWAPIGWARIAELVAMVDGDTAWDGQQGMTLLVNGDSQYWCDDDIITVADVAAPYWQRPAGPTWWCHVTAGHPAVDAWLAAARWLHPAVSVALRDETMLICEKMKHLLYEVPVRVSGGLLFELLGQSVGDPARDEDNIPVVLRAWQAQNFLITALHVKGAASNVNVIGVTEVQELLSACGSVAPKSIHEVIAHLACRLARWDDRLWRKYVFGAADEIELKFVNRRNQEDLNLLCIIFNQDIRRLATQVIRVKWSLHARDEIIFELLKYLGRNTTKSLLQGVKKDTRQMIEEQEAVRGRLFTIQDVMQSTVRAWLQINADDSFGLQKPISDKQVQIRKLELQQLVSMFQHEAETHGNELLSACGSVAPKGIHEVIAHLACRLARWDDRLWRKYVLGAADEIELKFVNRRNQEDLNLLCIIFNQDIRILATQVIRVKWSLHARDEIIFELLKYLGGNTTKSLLQGIKKDTRQMIEEKEAVRGRLFTIQDVMQSTVRAWLQDKSLRITHNLTIFGGCGLILSIITGLFGINVDGIPGAKKTPYAFALFSGLLFLVGFLLIIVGIIYFGLQKPISDEQVQIRKLELQQLVSMFQHEAETHGKVREGVLRSDLPPRAADLIYDKAQERSGCGSVVTVAASSRRAQL
ncbi:hypothetical protein EJB05_16284, partial [Eragrostis curvula]